jgi:hypothetical protein
MLAVINLDPARPAEVAPALHRRHDELLMHPAPAEPGLAAPEAAAEVRWP